MNMQDAVKEAGQKISRSATVKLFVISMLALILLIPATMVKSMIQEREMRKAEAIDDINSKWGRPQTVVGPAISIPYKKYIENENGKRILTTDYVQLLPDEVDIKSELTPEVRYRGIFESVLYSSEIVIHCRFPRLPLDDLRIRPEDMLWSGAAVWIGLSDMRGIKKTIEATHDGEPIQMAPGIASCGQSASGVSAGIRLDPAKQAHAFTFVVHLNGSQQLYFTPVGKSTTVSAHAQWKDPSFVGDFLPVERSISDQAFSAKWHVLYLNRNYPQYWTGTAHDLSSTSFGVMLFSPVDVYQKTMRTAKYALMFIAFTFYAFFLTEIMNRLRVHPVQYLLIGFAMIVFYTLLLSISEHAPFGLAYLISAAGVTGLITGYTKSILKSTKVTWMVGGLLIALYAYLYIILQLEDYALLMGSVGLFAVLAAIMYLTRKINWYAISERKTLAAESNIV
ncbi:MAG: cell envelope integrity protein CreD [Desulfatitalea sp.]